MVFYIGNWIQISVLLIGKNIKSLIAWFKYCTSLICGSKLLHWHVKLTLKVKLILIAILLKFKFDIEGYQTYKIELTCFIFLVYI